MLLGGTALSVSRSASSMISDIRPRSHRHDCDEQIGGSDKVTSVEHVIERRSAWDDWIASYALEKSYNACTELDTSVKITTQTGDV